MSSLMRDVIEVGLGVLIAFVLHSILTNISLSLVLLFNVFSLVVLYFSLNKGEVFGACVGSVCGLIKDSFSLGVFGVAGISNTIMGFVAGHVSRKINVMPLQRRFVFILLMIVLELAIWISLYSFIFSERLNTGNGLLIFQPLATAILGSIVIAVVQRIKE